MVETLNQRIRESYDKTLKFGDYCNKHPNVSSLPIDYTAFIIKIYKGFEIERIFLARLN